MSKPWFLDVAEDPAAAALRGTIRGVLGRELNDARSVVERAQQEGKVLENGEGVQNGH
jgi:cystathionine beta-synthase